MLKSKWVLKKSILFFILIFMFEPLDIHANEELSEITNEIFKREIREFYKNWEMESKVTGSVFVFVHNGEVYHVSFGVEDLKTNNPIRYDRSLFRIGSITKSFTAIAIMQLVEEGKIDLNENVNTYLKNIRVPETFDQPITLNHLLTHTAGFDEKIVKMQSEQFENALPLQMYLQENLPERIREPGLFIQYSNHGYALAGAIIEDVTGMTYEEYIRANILEPLEMRNTHPRITSEALEYLVKEYNYVEGDYNPAPVYDLNGLYPAGAFLATAEDMSHYIEAHLNRGEYKGKHLLTNTSHSEMHHAQFRHHSLQKGIGYGFFEYNVPDFHVTSHTGATNSTYSTLILDHTRSFGMFFSATGPEAIHMLENLYQMIDTTLYPYSIHVSSNYTNFVATNRTSFEGEYYDTRVSLSDPSKIMRLFVPATNITANDNGITVTDASGSADYIQIDDFVFKNQENGNTLVFHVDSNGEVTHALPGYGALVKTNFWQSPNTHRSTFTVLIVWFTIVLLAWISLAIRDVVKKSWKSRSLLWQLNGIGVCAHLFFYITVIYAFERLENINNLMFGLPWYLQVATPLPYISVPITALMIYLLIKNKRKVKLAIIAFTIINIVLLATSITLLQHYQLI
ncbi:serine hydrolase domain-containing protein [Evansella cellulosilytica]|uniref:Beta-lactamase n=1 Tax=Evansella cellulosilytica (strain ATCC 21833 / DSM 2522 / FERM P-1141 / JCM 9156 / N-4) TaxID=649639 RepID=E6TUR0_EVAC2|nr:serine hydrolase [Evansella cellulosilytica]ADU32062.1 beta-lactamase [Evansella cellulosilytica DSM 2522]